MKRQWMRRTAGVLTASVAVMSVAACGSASGGASGDDKIKVGVAISLSGVQAKTGEGVLNGYKLWIKQMNADGGLLGRDLELVSYDDRSDPATGARLYEKLIVEDGVDLVLAPFSSTITSAVAPVTERHKVPMLAAGASSAEIWSHGLKYIFGVASTADTTTKNFLQFAQSTGLVQRVAIVNQATPFPQEIASTAATRAEALGMDVALEEEYPPEATDMSGLVAKIRDANADLVLAGTYYDDGVLLARQMAERGVRPKLFMETIGPDADEFAKTLGEKAEGILGSGDWMPGVPTPGSNEFAKSYEGHFGSVPIYQAALAYASGELLAAAVKEVGSLDGEELRVALSKLKMTTLVGDYAVDDNGLQVGKKKFVIQIQDGKQEVIWPEEFATGEFKTNR